ncbi:MAG TPA: hypothetical protein VFH51_17195, partial [Myxococcota bacterium]|nr:hypothetical protein [Myxococcota bacterium]
MLGYKVWRLGQLLLLVVGLPVCTGAPAPDLDMSQGSKEALGQDRLEGDVEANAEPGPAAPELETAASLVIYDDGLQNEFEDWSWTMHNLAATSVVHGGTYAIAMDPSGWGGVKLQLAAGIDVSGYASLSFWVHGGTTGKQALKLYVKGSNGANGTSIVVGDRITGGIPTNAWAQVTIPVASLGLAAGAKLTDLVFQDNSGANQAVLYIDDIVFLPAPVITRYGLFDDKLQNTFTDGSWGTHSLVATAAVHGGAYSASFVPQSWQGLQFSRSPGLAASQYTGIEFWIHGGATGGQKLWVGVTL